MRNRMLAFGIVALLVTTMGISAAGAAEMSRPRRRPIDRVLIISLPGVGWRDLAQHDLPNLHRVLDGAAVADLSTRAPLLKNDLAGNYASLNAGDKAVGPGTALDGTGIAADAAYNADEPLTGTSAGEVFAQRTGRVAGAGLVVLDAARLAAANRATPYHAKVGALADVLAQAGWSRSVIANGDGFDATGVTSQPHRAAAIALMGTDGTVPTGELSGRLLAADPGVPFGVHLDAEAVDRAFAMAWTPRSVVLVEGSDLVRVEQYRSTVTTHRAKELRANALRRTDALIGRLLARVDLERDAVVVVGTAPNKADGRLAAVAVRAPGVAPGLLRSGTTQRTGFVQLMDVAPSVLDLVGIEAPQTMRGRAVAVGQHSRNVGARQRFLIDADSAAQFRAEILAPVASALFALVVGLLIAALLAAFRPRSWWGPVASWWAAVTLAFVPAVYLARAIPFHRIGVTGYWLWIALASTALAAGARLLGRRHVLDPVLALLGVTVVVLGLDVVIGSPLQFNGALGFSPEVAGRFIGFGNAGFATFAASALFLACLVAVRNPRRGRAVALAVLAGAVILDGAPFWGADVGGVLSLVPAFGIVGMRLMGWRIRIRTVVVAAVGTLVAVAGAIAVDLSRPPGARTHLGRLVEQVQRQGVGAFSDVVIRKLEMNLASWSSSPFRLLVPLLLMGVVALWLRPDSRFAETWRRLDPTRALTLGFAALVVLGYALNDTGVLVIALMGATGLAVVVAIAAEPVGAEDYGRALPSSTQGRTPCRT